MRKFFEYNWQVRDEWFAWCQPLTADELLRERIGGVGSILYTLFHIIDVEYSWIRAIQGKEDLIVNFNEYNSLEQVKRLSDKYRVEINEFLNTDVDRIKSQSIKVPWDQAEYTVDDILHHIIAHEIHHIGQLSIWSRELNLEPIPVNFVGRKI
ncbi:DinB family protein [Piscibacillus halophilus]|uniref:DinB family protein n=1 Tax=Piscibacillus halophilus TaxID=571933 RepID=UPI0015888440|nr:DinB family protein [Piscibacillus halophilus]